MNIGYYLRDNKAKKPQRIWAIFTENKTPFKIDTGKKILPCFWSLSKHQVLSQFEHAKAYNDYLKQFSANLEKVVLDLQFKKIRLHRETIQEHIDKLYNVNKVDSSSTEVVDFVTFMDAYIKNKATLSRGTKSKFRQVRINFILALKLANKYEIARYNKLSTKQKSQFVMKPDRLIDFSEITLETLEQFEQYLYTHKFKTRVKGKEVYQNYKRNYIGTQIKTLKQFIDAAIAKQLVPYFKSNTVKSVTEDIDSVYTNYAELQKMIDVDLKEEKTEQEVRDRYVFNSYLGLRYSDLNKLKPQLFSEVMIKGKKHFVYASRNQKTDGRVCFPLHETAVKILKKYNFQFPVLSKEKYNKHIKMVAFKAGLRDMVTIRETRGKERIEREVPKYELISSHTGRRSFCTNYYEDGVAIQAIMKVSGHKTEAEFLKYINKDANVKLETLVEQMEKTTTLDLAKRAA